MEKTITLLMTSALGSGSLIAFTSTTIPNLSRS